MIIENKSLHLLKLILNVFNQLMIAIKFFFVISKNFSRVSKSEVELKYIFSGLFLLYALVGGDHQINGSLKSQIN